MGGLTLAFLFTPSSFSPFFPIHWASINRLLTKLEFQAQLSAQHPVLPKFHFQMSNFNIPKVAWGTFASKSYNQTEAEANYSAMAKGYWSMPIQCMETKEKWKGQKHDVHFQWLTCAHFLGGYFAAGVQCVSSAMSIWMHLVCSFG